VFIALGVTAMASVASASPCDQTDPAWLMCEDFEDGDLGWEAWFSQSPWVECDGCPGGVADPDRIRLENDPEAAHDGDWSLHLPAGAAAGYRGATLRYATCAGAQQAGCTLAGHDQLFFRTWVRLAPDHQYVHHFVGIGGSRQNAYWEANGNAGCRPNGERWAGTRVDLNAQHRLFFYTYYPEMNCDSGGYCSGSYAQNICDGCASKDMPCTDGLECCWGNHFSPEDPVVLEPGAWTCIEMTMRINTVGLSDGMMAFWVDDELAHEVTGMHWRDVPELQLNRVELQHYIANGDADESNRVWFDDVVVSTERIGCSDAPPGDPGDSGDSGDSGGSSGGPPPGDGAGDSGGSASTNDSGSGGSATSDTAGGDQASDTTMGSEGVDDDATTAFGCSCRFESSGSRPSHSASPCPSCSAAEPSGPVRALATERTDHAPPRAGNSGALESTGRNSGSPSWCAHAFASLGHQRQGRLAARCSLWNIIRWRSPRTIKETFAPPRDWRYPFMDEA
jgi:hypothetical protein